MEREETSAASKQDNLFRKVVITGGLGFIGSQVFRRVSRLESVAETVILDRVSYAADFRRLAPAGEAGELPVIRGDIRSRIDVAAALHECDAVIHLAAETHGPRAYAEPDLFFDVNVAGTETLLSEALKAGVKRFIHVSSSEVYGPALDPLREEAALRPVTPYASSKAMAEEAVMMAAQQGLHATILRPTNAIGAGQNPEKLFPRFVMRALLGQRLTIEGSGYQERTFLPVGDLANAIALVLTAPSQDNLGVYNVSGAEDLTVLDVADRVSEVTGRSAGRHFLRDRLANVVACRIDDTRIRGLGYRQSGSVDAELRALRDVYCTRARKLRAAL